MFRDKNLKAYDKAYYERQKHMRGDYFQVARWMNDNIPGEIFGDVGCGEAYLISDLHNKFGKRVWGVDGSPDFDKFVDPKITDMVQNVDLTKKHTLSESDTTISMEVGEHLPERSADTLVDNIVSTKAKTILFTAAPPGQNGTNHINLQPPEYWQEKFEHRGYILDERLTKKFKRDLNSKLKHAWWYINNVIILQKQ